MEVSEKHHRPRSTVRAVNATRISTPPSRCSSSYHLQRNAGQGFVDKTHYFQLLWTELCPPQTHMLSLNLRGWHMKMRALGDNPIYKKRKRYQNSLSATWTQSKLPGSLRARKRAFTSTRISDS